MPSEGKNVELLQGTLGLIVLRALSTMGPLHAYALATRLAQVSDHPLSLNQGTLYPALVRLEQQGWIKGSWGRTESNREAKFYAITKPGEPELLRQAERWRSSSPVWSTSSSSTTGNPPRHADRCCMPQRRRFRNNPFREIPRSLAAFS